MKKILLLAVLFASSLVKAQSYEIPSQSVFSPEALAVTALIHNEKGFSVATNSGQRQVYNHNIDKTLRNISPDKLEAFTKAGYIAINQLSDGEYSLNAKVRGNGGGPVTAAALYWLTKTTCYSVATTAAGAAVATGVGAAAGATAAALATTAVGVGTSVVVGSVPLTAASVASSVVGTMGAAAATELTMATIAATGITGAVAAIETASLGAWALGMSIPFLP
jgi:hypothetical protein